MGFTHVEFMPVMEHPFFGSWGYQITGYFAPSSRFGTPQDFMYLVDYLHQRGIGVILDWVPSHFPNDEHGLAYFDGTHLYEHADPRKGFHPDWKSAIFNYGRNEVRAFLISNAIFWLDRYHIDGLRMDAIASMLYLDYSRKQGEWIPNQFGGRENLGSRVVPEGGESGRLRELSRHPDHRRGIDRVADGVAAALHRRAGLRHEVGHGLDARHAALHVARIPIHRKYHHNKLTFRGLYAFTENFVLPLSHDEVVHGKGSLLAKMAGDEWQKFANLRLLFGYMFTQPGKKLLFMGGEIAQWSEWNHDGSVDWHSARISAAPGRAALGARPERVLPQRARAVRTRLQPRRLALDRCRRLRPQRAHLHALRKDRKQPGGRRLQLHAGAAAGLSRGRATARDIGANC